MNNPMEMIKGFMGNGLSPEQMIMKIMGNKNPMINNLIQMAQKGNQQDIMKFAENIYKEKCPNKNFQDDFENFMKQIKS